MNLLRKHLRDFTKDRFNPTVQPLFVIMQSRSIYKLFASAVGVILCLILFVCCSKKQSNPAHELVIGARADDYVVEPLKSKLGMYPLNVQICEPLVRITPDYQIEPLLAIRWERQGTTWRFFLRPGVLFSNGQPLTGEAVRYTFA